MGFPTEFFPVLFAIPRMAGWLAHWKESLDDPDTKIMRPQEVSRNYEGKIWYSTVTVSLFVNQCELSNSCITKLRFVIYFKTIRANIPAQHLYAVMLFVRKFVVQVAWDQIFAYIISSADDVLLFLQVYTGVWLRHYTPIRERVLPSQSEELGQIATSNATRRRRSGSAL
jgi:hypothetical protein